TRCLVSEGSWQLTPLENYCNPSNTGETDTGLGEVGNGVENTIIEAAEEEKDHALRDADFSYRMIPDFDWRLEETQVEHHYVGFVGELVICRHQGWKRNFPRQSNRIYDAQHPDMRYNVEIKTRRRFWEVYEEENIKTMKIKVEPDCDMAVLLFLYEDEQLRTYVVPIRYFNNHELLPDWYLSYTEDDWYRSLRESGVPERFIA